MMSFGRWLLVNSFSIFLLTLIFFGYIYRSELQLERAYQQLINIDSTTVITSSPAIEQTPVEAIETKDKATNEVSRVETNNSSVIDSSSGIDLPVTSTLATIPVVPTVESPVASDKVKTVEVKSKENRLYMARQAYWDKNYADAIYFYRQLIQQDNNNPDYLGELGNIYYSLNDNQNASRLYYQAALVFINHNQPERARLLVAPIIAMNRDLGEKLKFKLK